MISKLAFVLPIVALSACAYGQVVGDNLLANPSFETHVSAACGEHEKSTGVSSRWNYELSGGTYIRAETGEPMGYGPTGIPLVYEGKEAIFIGSLRGGTVRIWQDVAIKPGTQYVASAWVRPYDADGQGFGKHADDSVSLAIQEFDSKGKIVAEYVAVSTTSPSSAYVQLTKDFRGADTASIARMTILTNIGCNHWHGSVQIDDCSVRESEVKR